jgi:hypothetical protein
MPTDSSRRSIRARFSPKAWWMARVSASTWASLRSEMAARCKGLLPAPSRKLPALATASITERGPTVQVTRQPSP